MQLIGFFQKIKINQKFLSIHFDSWSELSGLLMANRQLVPEIQVPNATTQEYVWLIEICDKDQLQFLRHFATKHTTWAKFLLS